uniref:ATP synthase F0 subunit 8 n=1 Tax=Iothia sp. TaxID=3071114 RepID=A0AA96HTT5_9GAST|nr:ATP synthase F0 subunit 8 [Iothia sp.]
MPQLGPLNWLVLFYFFWFLVGAFSLILWWSFDMSYFFGGEKSEGGFLGGGSVWSW